MKNDCFEIIGGNKLVGEIRNQTSKNATLPIMSASILANGEVELREIPHISDVDHMVMILRNLGAKVNRRLGVVKIDPREISNTRISPELCRTMRSSLFLLGSMLAKFKTMDLSMPGGCMIGDRPIDVHISAFSQLGVKVRQEAEYIHFDATCAEAKTVRLRIPSVGATENIIQFACLLPGKTTILNPAREPEIVDLANFLNIMGAKILGAGTNKITIYGVNKLRGTIYTPMGDRIVSGTLMTAVACVGGDLTITNACPYQNEKIIKILRSLGCQIDIKNDIIHISKDRDLSSNMSISTDYYPGFPTDLQSMILALVSTVQGKTLIKEKIFENRFLTIPELKRMGAEIEELSNRKVRVRGVDRLIGCEVEAYDLRGGASLVLAGLMAEGTTIVRNVHFIDRGYDHLEEMLTSIGANIRRI